MRSYIKIYGPPVYEAIKALEEIAIPMEEVCIMDTVIEMGGADLAEETEVGGLITQEQASPGMGFYPEAVAEYFVQRFGEIERERCENIISTSGQSTGEYDFYFEWFSDPTVNQLEDLIKKIDEALEPLGCKYTITTREN
jgi:hypothetical protein